MEPQVPEPTVPPPPKVVAPPGEAGMLPMKLLVEKSIASGLQQPTGGTQQVGLPSSRLHGDPKLQVLAVSTSVLPQSETLMSPPPAPGSSATPLSPPVGGGGTCVPSQTFHRSRKEKLIVRSDADNIEVQATALNSVAETEAHEPADNEAQAPAASNASSPTKTNKKADSPNKTTRPYNRRKHASESDKKRDSLSKKVLVSNAQRRSGQDPAKKANKRRNTVSCSETGDSNGAAPTDSNSTAQSEQKVKTSPPKKSKGALTPQEEALLPILLKGSLPRVSTTPAPPPPTPPAPSTPKPSSPQANGDKRMDLRLLGLSNVLPIFKPNQKPWNLLKQLLENTQEDPEARKRQAAASQASQPLEIKEEPVERPPSRPKSNLPPQNLDFWDSEDSDVEISEDDDDGDDNDANEDSSSSTDTADENPTIHQPRELEVVALPVDIRGEKVSFPPESVSVLNRFLAATSLARKPSREQILKSRVRSESESSLPGFNPSLFPPPLLPRPASTPAAPYSEPEAPTLKDFDHTLSRSTEFQFKPLDAPVSPGGLSSRWSWGRTGRDSPFSGGGYSSRIQAASPSGSSTGGGSARRYSRRRHSRLYPPFETSHCMYTKHFCPAPLEPGSTYCIKHVSEKYSPYYVRCAFMSSKTGRRCQNMQYSRDGKNKFCNMHASRLALLRQKLYRKPRPSKHVKDYMNEMRHIQKKLEKPKRTEAAAYLEDYCDYKLQTQCMENEIEVVEPMEEMNLDVEDLTKFQVEHDSDGGCDLEDEYECLKNAGYYTTEEVVRILKSKLSKLKELYVKEFDFLKLYYLLKRQEYLLAEDKLQSSGLRVSRNPRTLFRWQHLVTPEFIKKEMKTFEKTKVLLNYNRLRGQTAVLHHLAKKRYEEVKKDDGHDDTESDDENPLIKEILVSRKTKVRPSKPVCCKYDDGILTCERAPLPASEFCHQHILKDHDQVLFQACNYPTDDSEYCQNPLLKKLHRSGCDYHRSFRMKRFVKSSTEKKGRSQLLKSLPSASFKEQVKMLEDLVTKKVGSVEDFDREVDYLMSKGLDCSDSSVSDNENDYDFQLDDEEEEAEEPTAPDVDDSLRRNKRPHGNKGRRRHFGPYSKRQRILSEAISMDSPTPVDALSDAVVSYNGDVDSPGPAYPVVHLNGDGGMTDAPFVVNGQENGIADAKVPNGIHLSEEKVNGDRGLAVTTATAIG